MFPSVDAFPAFMLSSCGPKIPVMSKQVSTAGAGVSLSARRKDRRRAHAPISGDMTGSIASTLRHQRSPVHLDRLNEPAFGREAELQEVLDDLEARLASIGGIGIPDVFEEKLAAIEAVAAPYAIALFYEIRRLEKFLLLRRRFVRALGARCTVASREIAEGERCCMETAHCDGEAGNGASCPRSPPNATHRIASRRPAGGAGRAVDEDHRRDGSAAGGLPRSGRRRHPGQTFQGHHARGLPRRGRFALLESSAFDAFDPRRDDAAERDRRKVATGSGIGEPSFPRDSSPTAQWDRSRGNRQLSKADLTSRWDLRTSPLLHRAAATRLSTSRHRLRPLDRPRPCCRQRRCQRDVTYVGT